VRDATIGEFDIPGLPVKFSRWAERSEITADRLGEHNEDVLRELLSLTETEIAGLYADKIIIRDPLLDTSEGRQ
jgi:CoA:oxalate CoA-transferase